MKFKEIRLLIELFTIFSFTFEFYNWGLDGFFNDWRCVAYIVIASLTIMYVPFIEDSNDEEEK